MYAEIATHSLRTFSLLPYICNEAGAGNFSVPSSNKCTSLVVGSQVKPGRKHVYVDRLWCGKLYAARTAQHLRQGWLPVFCKQLFMDMVFDDAQ